MRGPSGWLAPCLQSRRGRRFALLRGERSLNSMEHALWKGRISFGLVEIPVRLWPAVKANELSFSLLDRRDFSPVGNKRYNKETGKEVPWDNVVRGFEYEPDEYVVLSDEELRRANVAAHETIEIMEFVDQNEIDPMYYETPYYVTPLQK